MVSYYVCEAKFMAELATGVGKTTFLVARKYQPTGEESFTFMFTENISPIRNAWLAEVKGREPANIEQAMKSSMKWESNKLPAVQQPEVTKP